MTEEQRKELYDAIDWDEKNALAETGACLAVGERYTVDYDRSTQLA